MRCVPSSYPHSSCQYSTHTQTLISGFNLRMYLPKPSTSPRLCRPGSAPALHDFNHALTGTLNKPINTATENYNKLIFAYVQPGMRSVGSITKALSSHLSLSSAYVESNVH